MSSPPARGANEIDPLSLASSSEVSGKGALGVRLSEEVILSSLANDIKNAKPWKDDEESWERADDLSIRKDGEFFR